jgi:peptidyl-prolyl cis-trans isomerase SurA
MFRTLFIILLFPVAGMAQEKVLDQVIAQVGGEYILQSEISEYYKAQKNQNATLPDNAQCLILNDLLFQKMLTNQAKIDSVKISDDQVENQLNARIDRVLSFMNNDVKQFEQYYGKSVAEMKEDLRTDLKNQMYAEEMQRKIVQDIKVTPAEVKEYFSSIPTDSLPYYNAEVEYSEINFYPKPSKIERQKVIDKLESIRARIVEDGQSFEDMAKKFSEDGSANAGGDLGWSKRGVMVPEFEAAVFNLEAGQVSPVVESEFGFHLIQLIERRGNSFHARHILIRPKLSDEDNQVALRELDSITTQIKDGTLTFADAVQKYSSKNFPSFSNGGRAINQKTENNFFEISDLEPDVYFAIDTMKVGSMSTPIKFKDPYGESYYKVIRLDSRTDPHKANLQSDFSRIKDSAVALRRQQAIQDWEDRTLQKTFVKIQPEWIQTCPDLSKWVAKDQ